MTKKGKPRELLLTIMRGNHDIIMSKEMLEEFVRVTRDPAIQHYVGDRDVARFLKDIGSVARVVRIRTRVRAVKRDPTDDIILWACYSGKAKYIVSGDKDLLDLGTFHRARIVTVDEMLKIMKEEK